jgi:hypothetical protein
MAEEVDCCLMKLWKHFNGCWLLVPIGNRQEE